MAGKTPEAMQWNDQAMTRMSVPVVHSPLHPQAQRSDLRSARIRWRLGGEQGCPVERQERVLLGVRHPVGKVSDRARLEPLLLVHGVFEEERWE
eukprot:15105606-Alexandrium_andersonii.AAC.1